MQPCPELSVIIPVFNEEAILRPAVTMLVDSLGTLGRPYEIILAENGSTDRTLAIATELERKFPALRLVSVGEPNYGMALRLGIESARGAFVICDEIDLCDVDFHAKAIELLEAGSAELVIGSKLAGGAADERPMLRHVASIVYTRLLHFLVGFPGTDTHGVKGFRRDIMLPVVEECRVDRDVFASELVIRAHRARVRVLEIPVRVKEMRPPSINLIRRVPGVLKNLGRLTWAIHFGRDSVGRETT